MPDILSIINKDIIYSLYQEVETKQCIIV